MTLIKWAHRPTLSLFNEIDRMFNTLNIDHTPGFDYDNYNPKFEVLDIDDAYILRGDFPGISKKRC